MPVRPVAPIVLALALAAPAAQATALTDITVFSSNADGHNWNGLIWNTRGADTDAPNRWNLYVSADPLSDTTPSFLNGHNDARTRIGLPLAPGAVTYALYAEGVGATFPSAQHFALNLYFDGREDGAGISAVQNLSNTALAPAASPMGFNLFGNAYQAGAGTLSTVIGQQRITLESFTWITDGQRDVVHPHWANDAPYAAGSGRLDYHGAFTLRIENVPEPGAGALLGLGLSLLGLVRARRAC